MVTVVNAFDFQNIKWKAKMAGDMAQWVKYFPA